MTHEKGQIEDSNLAKAIAMAEDSHRTRIRQERLLGATVANLTLLNTQANKAGRIAAEQYKKNVREEAINNIINSSDSPVIEKELFESFWGRGSGIVWARLQNRVAKEPEIPLEFVLVLDDEFILRGDLRTASQYLIPNSSGFILKRIVEYLGTEDGKNLLVSQHLSPGFFAEE